MTKGVLNFLNSESWKDLLEALAFARAYCKTTSEDLCYRLSTSQFEEYPNARPAPALSPELQAALHPLGREGQGIPSQVDPADAWSTPVPLRAGPPLPSSPVGAGRNADPPIPPDMADRLRQQPPSIPRSTIGPEPSTADLPRRPGMEVPPIPREAAIAASEMIRCYGDQWVPVHSEDGRLLGAMPRFGDGVEQVYTRHQQQLSVGWLMLRTVVIPYNRGVDPRDIEGFVAAPGLRPGPLATANIGISANLDNPDIGRAV